MDQSQMIDYKKLRKISPEAARVAVLNFLHTNKNNISKTAKTFGLQRSVIYNIIRREKTGSLKDNSKAPKKIHNKTAREIEEKIILSKNQTGFGPRRLFKYLQIRYGLYVAYGTIRSVIYRYRKSLSSDN